MTLVAIDGSGAAWSRAPTAPAGTHAAPGADWSAVHVRGATIQDMERVEPLINGFARRGLMLPKTRDQLYRMFREFMVAEDEHGRLLGCVALRVYTADVAEVSALAVAEVAHGRGVGRRLLDRLTAEAATLGLETLFALTLEEGFFRRLGYRVVDRSEFPLKVESDCAACPRRDTCAEVAVARRITDDTPSRKDEIR